MADPVITGEHHVPVIGAETPVRLGLVVTLVTLLVGAIATGGAAHWRLGTLERAVEKQSDELRTERDARHATDLRLQRIEDNVEYIKRKLDQLAPGRPR